MNDIFSFLAGLHAQIFDPARLPVAAAAVLIVSAGGALLGPFAASANPILWRAIDFLYGPLGSKLDNTERSRADLLTRGTIISFTALGLAFLAGVFFQTLSVHYPAWKLPEIVALVLIMSAGAIWFALTRLYKALNSKNLIKGAFYTIAKTTRTNLAANDEYTITRVGIGMAAKGFDKGIVGPILWYLIAGLPAAYLYAGLAALAWRFGKEGYTKGFGSTALALEKLMGWVPNAVAGLLLAAAGFITPTAGMGRALFGLMPGHAGRAAYAEGGAPVTALAYALRVSLGGATQDLDASAIRRSWAGPKGATAKLDAKHLHRALYITVIAHLLFFCALVSAIVIGGHDIPARMLDLVR